MLFLRARYYKPDDGRFISKDSFKGIYTDPFTYNSWAYAHDNPVILTDPNGHCDLLCIIAILTALGILTSGCSANDSVGLCPPLPENLQPDALKNMPRAQAITNIRDYFGIKLPPLTSYTDLSGSGHNINFKFVYSPFKPSFAGYTPWFTNDVEGRWGAKWGDVIIFETTFTHLNFNAYDIAGVMVHEAVHAWEQHTLSMAAKDPSSRFIQDEDNLSYYTYNWGNKHNAALEYEASSYVLAHTPSPLCLSSKALNNENGYLNLHTDLTPISGFEYSPWRMTGYPLP